jgi:hypothetical protein
MQVLKLSLFIIIGIFSQLTFGKTLKLDNITSVSGTQDIVLTTTGDINLSADNVLFPTCGFNNATIRDSDSPSTNSGFCIDATGGFIYVIINGGQRLAIGLSQNQFFKTSKFLMSPQSPTSLAVLLGETGAKNTGFHAEDSDADLHITADGVDVMQLESTQGIALLPMVFNDDTTFETSLIIDEIATPVNPSAGSNKLYFKSGGGLYKLDSSGTETEVGAGGGSAPYSAMVSSAGVVSSENTNWINGNCVSGGGVYTCTLTGSPFSATPTCFAIYTSANDPDANISIDGTTSTTSIKVFPSDGAGTSLNTSDSFNLLCQE